MRIKFTAAFDQRGDETGSIAEIASYTPNLELDDDAKSGLIELYYSAFGHQPNPPCQKKVLALSHAIEHDRATGELVWRVYVSGFVCCQPAAAVILAGLQALTNRYVRQRREGVHHPPTDARLYKTKNDGRLLN